MRDKLWLENRFEYLYRKYFYDIDAPNQIEIGWGRRAKNQLGSIRRERINNISDLFKKNFKTTITINRYFQDGYIPDFVIDAVIIHELTHYSHGFNSPLPKVHIHPHKHGVVSKELHKRGIHDLEKKQKKWIKDNWLNYLKRKDMQSGADSD